MNPEQLKAAGFSEAEVGQYTGLQNAGFTDSEISDHLRKAPVTISPVKTAPTEQPGFFSRVGSDLYKRGSNIVDTLSKKSWGDIPKAETLLQVAGDVAGAGNDIVTEGIKSVGNTIVPDRIKGYVKEAGRAIIETPIGQQGVRALKTGAEAYGEFKRQYPDVAKDIESVVNIASFVPLAKGVKATGSLAKEIGEAGIKTTKPLVQEFYNVGKDIVRKASNLTPEIIDKKIKKEVEVGFKKGIKPTISGKKDAGLTEKFYDNATTASKDLVESGLGDIKTVEEMSKNIRTQKKNIWDKATTMAKESGEEGALVDLTPVISDMRKTAQNPNLMRSNPGAVKLLNEMADSWESVPLKVTPPEAEELLAQLNAQTHGFWRNPDWNNPQKPLITERAAQLVRAETDKTIESYRGPGWQDLRKKYGAQTAIEKGVTDRANVHARANVKGFFDLSDIYTAGEFASALLTKNPVSLAKAISMYSAKKYIKSQNNVDNIVRKMFSNISTLTDESKGLSKSRAFAKSSPWNPPEGSIEFNKNPLRMDTDYTPNNQAIRGDIEMPSGLEMDRQKVFDAGNVWVRPQGVTYGGKSPQAIGSPPMRGEFNPSVQGTPGSKEQAVFFKGTIPTTYYSHPNLGDETKTYWVNEAAKMRAAEEARIRYGK